MVARASGVSASDFVAAMASRFAVHLDASNDDRDLLEWGRYYLPSYYTHAPSRMHLWLAEQTKDLDDRGIKIGAIGPRGGAKSAIITLTLVLRRAVEGKETNILICSDSASQAIDHLRNIKEELETNDQLQEDFPEACGTGPIWRENMIQLRNGVRIRAIGTLSRIRGMRRRHVRPSLIIIDDPENDEHISSTIMRDRTRTWFRRTVMHMGNRLTNYIAMGTAMHREGLINHIVRLPGWRTRRVNGKPTPFKSILKWPTRMDMWDRWESIYYDVDNPQHLAKANAYWKQNKKEMLAGSQVLWKSYEPLLHLMKLRAEIGHQAFEGEKQGNPINLETVEWPESYFEDIWFHEWPKIDMLKVIALDPSKGRDAKKGDYSAIIKLGVTAGGLYYVEADLERRPVDAVIGDSAEAIRKFNATDFGVEVNQFQSLLADELMRELEFRDLSVNVHEIDNRVKKEVRVRRLSPLLAKRRLRFKSESRGTTLLVQQLRDFPNGDHDDGPDALEMATRIAAEILEENIPVDNVRS